MHALNASFVAAFPIALREHVLAALETFPEPEHPSAEGFSVKVAGEMITIPHRLYHSPSQIKTEHLTHLEKEIVDCLLTRHHERFCPPAAPGADHPLRKSVGAAFRVSARGRICD